MSRIPDAPAAADRARQPAASLQIGAAMAEAFGIFGRRFVPLATLMLAILGTLSAATYGIGYALPSNGGAATVIATVVAIAAYLVGNFLAQTAATVAVVDDLRRQPFSLGNGLRVTVRRLMPVLGATVLVTLAILAGTVCLVVPGIIVTVMLYVAVPVCAVERTSATASLARSRLLTEGQRWRIFAIHLIVSLGTNVVGRLIDGLESQIGTIPDLVLDVVWQSVSGAFEAVLTAVIYYRLRILKEGVDIAAIADVFD